MTAFEVNFDGLVGPTHHYGGLGHGNLASQAHGGRTANPREAALQGIEKMRLLVGLGLTQGVMLPHERPHVQALRELGFTGSDADVVASAARSAPGLLSAVSSASAMWAANAATTTASIDSGDGRVHLTPANLVGHLHRSLEAPFAHRQLGTAFADTDHFAVHAPLPRARELGDEGAANHTRLTAGGHEDPGVYLFVHGPAGEGRFTPRQSRLASDAIARSHGVSDAVFAAQSRTAIDAGVFHHDVIGVGDRDLLLVHEDAFEDRTRTHQALQERLDGALTIAEVQRTDLELSKAVDTYLFNSQLVGLPDGRRLLLVPAEVRDDSTAWAVATGLKEVDEVRAIDLLHSMRNGGGPACLRLRVVVTDDELASVHPGFLVDEARLDELKAWVRRHYRESLDVADLGDPHLLEESRRALDELTSLLGLGSLYDFQR